MTMKLKIKKFHTYKDTASHTIEFCDCVPDKDHLDTLSNKNYMLEEMSNIVETDDEADIEELNDLLSSLDAKDPGALDDAAEKLEELGFANVGNTYNVTIFEEIEATDYCLYLELNPRDIFVIASSSNRKLLNEYKKLIDNDAFRMKIKLTLQANPHMVTDKYSYFSPVDEDTIIEG